MHGMWIAIRFQYGNMRRNLHKKILCERTLIDPTDWFLDDIFFFLNGLPAIPFTSAQPQTLSYLNETYKILILHVLIHEDNSRVSVKTDTHAHRRDRERVRKYVYAIQDL